LATACDTKVAVVAGADPVRDVASAVAAANLAVVTQFALLVAEFNFTSRSVEAVVAFARAVKAVASASDGTAAHRAACVGKARHPRVLTRASERPSSTGTETDFRERFDACNQAAAQSEFTLAPAVAAGFALSYQRFIVARAAKLAVPTYASAFIGVTQPGLCPPTHLTILGKRAHSAVVFAH
jgi:hypothetical protein